MSYYYISKDGDFVDSSTAIRDPRYQRINKLEYAITRMVMKGYTQTEIEEATKKIFDILKQKVEEE